MREGTSTDASSSSSSSSSSACEVQNPQTLNKTSSPIPTTPSRPRFHTTSISNSTAWKSSLLFGRYHGRPVPLSLDHNEAEPHPRSYCTLKASRRHRKHTRRARRFSNYTGWLLHIKREHQILRMGSTIRMTAMDNSRLAVQLARRSAHMPDKPMNSALEAMRRLVVVLLQLHRPTQASNRK